MKTPIDTGFIHDLSQLDKLRQKALSSEGSDDALLEAAKQFEAIFTQMLFKSMRDANSAFESDLVDNRTSKFYQEMADEQMTSALSREGSLGLADMIVQQLKGPKAQEPTGPVGMLKKEEGHFLPLIPEAPALSKDMPVLSKDAPLPFLPSTRNVKIPNAEHSEKTMDLENIQLKEKKEKNKPFDSPSEFVSRLMPYAKKAASALGTDPAVLIAQAALETGWGKKVISNARGSSHNLFNIKADPAWKGNKVALQTLEFHQDIPVQEMASFRAYGAYEESFDDYVHFLNSNPRYASALEQSEKPDLFIRGLHNAGYATDPQYSHKVMSVFDRVKELMEP